MKNTIPLPKNGLTWVLRQNVGGTPEINVIREEGYYCLFCMEEVGKGIDRVAAVYDWQDPLKVVGYYCPYHWQQVYDFEEKQKRAYEEMTDRYKTNTREKK